LYTGPVGSAADLGTAGEQFTTFTVVGPAVTGRLPVLDPNTGSVNWIDAAGVGPA